MEAKRGNRLVNRVFVPSEFAQRCKLLFRQDVDVSVWTNLCRIAARCADRNLKTRMFATGPAAFRIERWCDEPDTTE